MPAYSAPGKLGIGQTRDPLINFSTYKIRHSLTRQELNSVFKDQLCRKSTITYHFARNLRKHCRSWTSELLSYILLHKNYIKIRWRPVASYYFKFQSSWFQTRVFLYNTKVTVCKDPLCRKKTETWPNLDLDSFFSMSFYVRIRLQPSDTICTFEWRCFDISNVFLS